MSDDGELPPDLDRTTKDALRLKARTVIARGFEILDDRSDEWVANQVRMLTRNDPWHEAICQAARDRIMRLSIYLERYEAAMKNFATNDARFNRATMIAAKEAMDMNTPCACPGCPPVPPNILNPGQQCKVCGYKRPL